MRSLTISSRSRSSSDCRQSDIQAIPPEERQWKGPKAAVHFDDIMEALRSLDKQANAARYRNPFGLRSRRVQRNDDDQGRPLA